MKSRCELADLWLDEGKKVDLVFGAGLAAIFLVIFYCFKVPMPSALALQLYSVIAASSASFLGFVIAALTLVVGLIPHVTRAFTKESMMQLFNEFKRAFLSSLVCLLISIAAMIYPHKFFFALVVGVSIYCLSTVVRTTSLLFTINLGVINEYLKDQTDAELAAQDKGEIIVTPEEVNAEAQHSTDKDLN